MNTDINIVDSIFDILKKYFTNYKENDKELQVRCFYCGDSISKKNKKSMYISKYPVEPYNQFVFHCFRASCGMSGNLLQLFKDTGLIKQLDKDQLKFLLETNKQSYKIKSKTIPSTNNITKLIEENQKTYDIEKLNYISKRLHLQKIPQFIKETVITNIKPFIPICQNNFSDSFKQLLISSSIGFKTFLNRMIISRLIINSGDIRYVKIKLLDGMDFFITSPQFNGLQLTQKGTIIMAEGIFSVLGAYYCLVRHNIIKSNEQVILGATGGGNINSFLKLKLFIDHNLGIPDWNVIIAADSDVSVHKFKFITKAIENLSIVYNTIDNDFGTVRCRPQIYKRS